MNDWQPIETAPKEGQILVVKDGVALLIEASSLGLRLHCAKVEGEKLSHWMPLPAPPE